MKIVHVINTLMQGGAERLVVDLSNEQVAQGHEVIIFLIKGLYDKAGNRTDFFAEFLDEHVKTVFLNLDAEKSRIGRSVKAHNALKNENPDIVHFHLGVILYFLYDVLIDRKIKFVHTIHNLPEKTVSPRLKTISRFYYRRHLIHPVAISGICNQSYRDFYRLGDARCIYNGRKQPQKSSLFEKVHEEVLALKKTGNEKVFIHAARFQGQKNQGLLVDAFNRLASLRDDFILIVLGDGYENTEGLELKRKACDRIFFLGNKRNIEDYFHASDAFCLTSFYEGLPISLLEALACGVVPICTAVGGISDVIADRKNGLLVEGFSVEEYVAALVFYLDHGDMFSPEDLQAEYKLKYSIEACAASYLSYYDELLHEKKK